MCYGLCRFVMLEPLSQGRGSCASGVGMGSRGRRSAAYLRARERLLGAPCWECGAPATIADHQPPLSAFPTPEQWEGVLLPHCRRCSGRQGARLKPGQRAVRTQSREW